MPQETLKSCGGATPLSTTVTGGVLIDLIGPRFRWESGPHDPEREPRQGRDETLRFLDAQRQALPGLHTEIEDITDGENGVVAVVRHTAVVPGSDTKIERRKLTSGVGERQDRGLREFPSREAALEAAGLSE